MTMRVGVMHMAVVVAVLGIATFAVASIIGMIMALIVRLIVGMVVHQVHLLHFTHLGSVAQPLRA